MARRLVIFDQNDEPKVVVRKAKQKEAPCPKAAKKQVQPAKIKTKINPTRKESAASSQKGGIPDYNAIFRQKYLNSVKKALANANRLMEDDTRPDTTYYALKQHFLENAILTLEKAGDNDCNFDPLSEPFFWNEFKRIAEIISTGPKIDTAAGKKVSMKWHRAGNRVALTLAKAMDKLRSERDGQILKAPPLTVRNTVFFINGTMMHLERQIEAMPERLDLPDLRKMYALVYKKSGMKGLGAKLADMIKAQNRRNIWKNQETLEYLLRSSEKASDEIESSQANASTS